MNFKSFVLTIFALSLLVCARAQEEKAYSIKLQVNNFQGDVCYLGYPYGDKKYIADTAQINANGEFVFEGTKALDGGLYFIYSPPPASLYFDLIVAEQNFSIYTDTVDVVEHMKPTGSVENEVFFSFQRFMREVTIEGSEINEKLKAAADDASKDKYKAELKALDAKVNDYRKTMIEQYPETFAVKFVKSTMNVEVPDAPKNSDGEPIDENFGYKYYKKHYFDNFDFSDKKILRTPNFYGKIEEYMDKMTLKHPDSIISSLHFIIEKAKSNDDVFRYCVQNLTHKYETSNIMGMDAVFVDMAENYYLTGDAFWADSATIAKITDRVQRLKPNLIGKPAPKMYVLDTLMRGVDALRNNSEFTVLYFYDPDCGHCKKKTPQLRDLYNDKLKGMGVTVVAANIKKDNDKWKKYIRENNLNWINVSDPKMQSNFRYEYNIETTPQLFILDEDKKIIAKKLDVEQIEEFITKQKEIKANNAQSSVK